MAGASTDDQTPIDVVVPNRTVSRRRVFDGAVWAVDTDIVDLGDAGVVDRDVLRHPGAVAVVALDEDERVVLVRQYRHPVRSILWELPAGMRDVAGEPMVETARRELAEEAGLGAEQWWTLLDLYKSSGGSDERMRIFLARGLTDTVLDGYVAEHEESTMEVHRVPLADVIAAVQAGRVHNAALVAGALAAAAHLANPTSHLRAPDALWVADPES
jgi:ADP-ribose pyrophosphatase